MANIKGARAITESGGISAQVKPDVDNKVYLLDGNQSPLVALTAKLRKRVTTNPKFTWFESEVESYIDAINYSTGYTEASTDLVVDNGTYFAPEDIVKVPRTGETMRVVSVATNTLTVVRSVGTVAATTLADNDVLWIIGSAFEEGSTSAEANSKAGTEVYNYVQIHKTAVEDTVTAQNTDMWTGPDLSEQRRIAGIKHARKIERSFFFGERALDTTGTHNRRVTGGLNEFVTTNILDCAGTISEAAFEEFLEDIFRYGSSKKYLFASARIVSAINSWARGKLQMFPTDKTYGINIAQYLSAHGQLMVVPHNMLTGSVATNLEYGGYGYIVDLENVFYRPQQNLDTKLHLNIQANDAETEKDEYRTHCGLMPIQEKTHGIIKDVLNF